MNFKITNKTKDIRKVWSKQQGRFVFVNPSESYEVLIAPVQTDIWKIEQINKKSTKKDLKGLKEN